MSGVRVRTAVAKGAQLKGGMVRRICVTLSEDQFFIIRDLAVHNNRSMSNQMEIMLKGYLMKAKRQKEKVDD